MMMKAPTETMVTPLFQAFENPSLLFCFVSSPSARNTVFVFSILPVFLIIF